MRFQPGNKRSRGRPKGSKNKSAKTLRDTINKFLEEEFEDVRACFYSLNPRDRAKLYCDLLQYGLPKLQAMNMEFKFENMTEAQIDDITYKLIESNEKQSRQLRETQEQLPDSIDPTGEDRVIK